MTKVRLSILNALLDALPVKPGDLSALLTPPPAAEPAETVPETLKPGSAPTRVSMTFCPDPITTTWDWNDLDYQNPNDKPNLNLAVMALILSCNSESTIGAHAWTQVEKSLAMLGFTNIVHHYFESAEKISHAAMVYARSIVPVNGKYVVAAVYRGSSSEEDFISDAKSELDGFYEAGMNGLRKLKAYINSQGLTKENTTLFITGHSYGAANASLVALMSTDLAERDSMFCYPFATPNYIRHGMTGQGMKMFSFDSNEDIVPQVPVGPNLDKTGVDIKYDRLDIQLNQPERYARFLKVYKYTRHKDYNEDSDFLPEAYSFKPPIQKPVNNPIIRNHMPYTYMAFLLSDLPDEVVDTYIGSSAADDEAPELDMTVGEIYKLPPIGWGLTVISWTSSDEAVASVGKTGLLAAKAAGTAILTATGANGAKAVVKVCVSAE